MKIKIDTDTRTLETNAEGTTEHFSLYSREAFKILSDLWLSTGWNRKYTYQFTWLGRPVIQMPADLLRVQELIYSIKPDVIIETGVAHGGSLVFYAGLCKIMGKGRVIGVDIEIRPRNRDAISHHELFGFIELVERDSVAPETIDIIKSLLKPEEKVLVILDSCHTKEHVRAELEAYGPLVAPGSFLIVADGIMEDLYNTPNGHNEWKEDNPVAAIRDYLADNSAFYIKDITRVFNESDLDTEVTYFKEGWLKKRIESN